MSDKIHGFKPIFAADSRLLILGSFPSVKSRKADFYYGNPQNRFWKMLCAFFGEKAESTEEKRALLLSRGIALWDAVASCEITGSADASIRNHEAADIPALLARTRIQNIFCNGRRAYEVLSAAYPSLPVPVRLLPSTSPANPRFDARVWEAALAEALGERRAGRRSYDLFFRNKGVARIFQTDILFRCGGKQKKEESMTYEGILSELGAMKDEKYRQFNERIVNIPAGSSIGVRTPLLRAYGKELVRREDFSLDGLLRFPGEVFEVRLLKCFCVGYKKMPFAEKRAYIERCLPLIDGWAVCDLFCSTLKEAKRHREELLPLLRACVEEGSEYYQRFAYVMLLGCYMEREYLPEIFSLLEKAHTQFYYTHMGAAWLIAEVLVKFYGEGVRYLQTSALDAKTLNKAVQKARESYRLTEEQKNSLKSLKK